MKKFPLLECANEFLKNQYIFSSHFMQHPYFIIDWHAHYNILTSIITCTRKNVQFSVCDFTELTYIIYSKGNKYTGCPPPHDWPPDLNIFICKNTQK